MAVLDDKLWVMGGKLGDYQDRNDVWSSADGATWTQTAGSAPWTRRSNHASVVFDNKIWIAGGYLEATLFNPVYRNDVWYSSDGKNWTCATSQAAWPARGYFEAVAFDNKMWILGGHGSSKAFNDMWYSSDGVNWTQATPAAAPWKARYDFQSVVYNNKLWVIGGVSGSTWLNDVWCYEMPVTTHKSGKWATAAPSVTVNAIRCNPSGGPVAFQYTLKKAGSVKIGVYACTGRKIRTLWNGVQCAGAHALEWDGCDAGRKKVGAGAHFLRFQTDEREVIRRIVVGNQQSGAGR